MSNHGINLLPEKSRSFTEKVLYFALHYLRYIIVITQIVVITVFFYRFTIDQQIVDLKEKVNQKQEIIKITAPIVVEAAQISGKMSYIQKQITTQDLFLARITTVFSTIPKEISLFDFEVTEKHVLLKGKSITIEAVRYIHAVLQKKPGFKKVRIDTVVKDQMGFIFSMVIDL